jgi:hypothetical protein
LEGVRMMYCDTHGLDLPCKKCLQNRIDEVEYIQRIIDDIEEKGRD